MLDRTADRIFRICNEKYLSENLIMKVSNNYQRFNYIQMTNTITLILLKISKFIISKYQQKYVIQSNCHKSK